MTFSLDSYIIKNNESKNRKVEVKVASREISQAVIRRLPRYYRYLGELLESGVERISSNELSKRMKVTASQIRQDLNNFGGFGQQGYGYNVKYLYTEIGKILGLNEKHKFVIIGAGNLGQALANYAAFENRGFVLKGLFDVNPRLAGLTIRGVEIRMMDELKDFVKENDIEIGVLTIPKTKAVEVAKEQGTPVHVGSVVSSDVFYSDDPDSSAAWRKMGVLCAEMECAALFMNAARAGKQALGILTISDHIFRDEAISAEARQTSFNKMMEIALGI